ncbi:MAG: hypothetical protein HYS06_04565 [Methylocystis sp.]|nr:hypothetical protein [Methylocystis sp.]MBI3274391.1 hypothetical protein [Methylocystis sp.]
MRRTLKQNARRTRNAQRADDETSASATPRLSELCPNDSELIGADACACAAAATPEADPSQTPEAVAPPPSPTPSLAGAFPLFGSSKRFYAFAGASLAAGLVLGFLSYPLSGVQGVLKARAQVETASLAQVLPWKSEIASQASAQRELASLLDELGAVRAQIAAMRYAAEGQRASERIGALEASREISLEANRASERATAGALARLDTLEARLERIERLRADQSVTGAVQKDDRDGVARQGATTRNESNSTRAANSPNAMKPLAAAAKPEAEKNNAQSTIPPGGYVLRQVSNGVAFVERGDGLVEEVARGDSLPGAGRVTAIARRGAEWVVITSRGVIDSRRD